MAGSIGICQTHSLRSAGSTPTYEIPASGDIIQGANTYQSSGRSANRQFGNIEVQILVGAIEYDNRIIVDIIGSIVHENGLISCIGLCSSIHFISKINPCVNRCAIGSIVDTLIGAYPQRGNTYSTRRFNKSGKGKILTVGKVYFGGPMLFSIEDNIIQR